MDVFATYINWFSILKLLIFFLITYLILKFLQSVFKSRTNSIRSMRIAHYIDKFMILFIPLAILMLIVLVVLINPLYHGLILLIVVVLGFGQFQNLIQGRLLLFDNNFNLGSFLHLDSLKGTVVEKQLFGLSVQTESGINFIPYKELISKGFIINQKTDIGFYKTLTIQKNKTDDANSSVLEFVQTTLSLSPHLNLNFKPEIISQDDINQKVQLKLLLQNEKSLENLFLFLEEQGYSTEDISE